MATVGIVALFLCLFCGVFGQDEVDVRTIGEALSYLSDEKDTTLGELVTEILAKSSSEQSSNWKFRDEAQRSLGDNLDLKNDLDDVINLELAESEFVGDCKGGKCHYCAKLLKHDVCLDATLLPLGFELKITVGKHVVFDKKITVKDIPPLCVKIHLLGKVCVNVYNVDIEKKSGCVSVSLTVLHHTVTVKLKCFHLKTADEPKALPFIQLMEILAKKTGQQADTDS